MHKVTFLLALFLCGIDSFSQVKIGSTEMRDLYTLIIEGKHDKVDSILDYYHNYSHGKDDDFLLNYTRFLNGYNKIQTEQNASAIAPYLEAGKRTFTYIKNNINENNASLSDCWPALTAFAEIFNYMNDSIIDEIANFSGKYYEEFGQKNLYSYYTVAQNTYQYHFSRSEWQRAIGIMRNYNRIAVEAKDSTMRIPISAAFIGSAYLREKNNKEAGKWLTDSYNRFQQFGDRVKYRAYCELLSDMACMYNFDGDNKHAYDFAILSCEMNKTNFGKNSKEYLNALDILSNCEIKSNMLIESRKHVEEFLGLLDSVPKMDIKEKQYYIVEKATSSASNLKNMALFEYLFYSKVNQAIDIDEYFYAFVASALSDAYISNGNYVKADATLNQALERLNDKKTDEVVRLYHTKGLLYLTLQNIEEALRWLIKAKDCYDSKGIKDVEFVKLLSNIAMCYNEKGDIELAKQTAEESLALYENICSEKNQSDSFTPLLLNNLATIYYYSKEYGKAKELLLEIIELSLNTNDFHGVAQAKLNIAECLLLEGDYDDAERFLNEVKVNELDSSSKSIFDFCFYLIQCLRHKENVHSLVCEYNSLQKSKITEIFSHFSETEREDYWTHISRRMVLFNSLIAMTLGSSEIIESAYESAIYTKSLLNNSSRLLGQMVKNCNTDIQNAYSSMQKMKRLLYKKNLTKDSVAFIREAISQQEKSIVNSIPDFSNRLRTLFKSYSEVRKMLSDGEAAVEFVFLPRIITPLDESELFYGAFLFTKNDSAPKLIQLCSQSDLEELIEENIDKGQEGIDNLYAAYNDTLYHQIWKKIEPYIPIGSKVYYSPVGYINKINISAISDGYKRLAEVYSFHEVSTTAFIDVIKQEAKIGYTNAALYGDINYYENVSLMEENAKTFTSYSPGNFLATRSVSRGAWDLLPGTKEEVISIAELLKNKRINVYFFTQNDANEESFKALDSNAPSVIHVATHGFYIPYREDITSSFFNSLHSYTKKDNSMLRCGLLLAGGNNAWTGKEIVDGVEDGILTADEISRIDLSNNKLIVLSACDTGLGDVDNIDGVFGLQRGLKRAGVKTILMSLWKVPDEETKELMTIFYRKLLEGDPPHRALELAQEHIKNSGKSPYYWAGFILLD